MVPTGTQYSAAKRKEQSQNLLCDDPVRFVEDEVDFGLRRARLERHLSVAGLQRNRQAYSVYNGPCVSAAQRFDSVVQLPQGCLGRRWGGKGGREGRAGCLSRRVCSAGYRLPLPAPKHASLRPALSVVEAGVPVSTLEYLSVPWSTATASTHASQSVEQRVRACVRACVRGKSHHGRR